MDVNIDKENLKKMLILYSDVAHDELESLQIELNSLVITDKEFIEQLDYGNIQYNLDLSKNSKIDWEILINQMSFRLEEGNGECFYELGLSDLGEKIGLSEEDLKQSVENLERVAFKLEANMQIIKFYRGKSGLVAEIVIRKNSFMNKNLQKNLPSFKCQNNGRCTRRKFSPLSNSLCRICSNVFLSNLNGFSNNKHRNKL